MKITKLGIILFIFLLTISLFPPSMGSTNIEADNATQSSQLGSDQSTTTPTSIRGEFINATLSTVNRNVTVLRDARVVLEDVFELTVLDNNTDIATLNITLPTVFAENVHQVRLFSQFENDLGLTEQNNSREYDVYFGTVFTTYYFDIRVDGFGLNHTNGPLFVQTEFTAVGLLDVKGQNTGQIARFMSPLVPIFTNLGYKDALIGIAIGTTQDSFDSSQIDTVINRLGNEMPRFTDTQNVITYFNMTRDAFDYTQDLSEQDMTEIVFSSFTPPQGAQSEELSVVVPTVIDNAERSVVFEPWGSVYVTETITYTHLGGEKNATERVFQNIHQVPGYLYTIDADASITNVYDEFGSLDLNNRDDDGNPRTTPSSVDGRQDLRINFRAPIYGGQSYTFTVEYEFNASEVVSRDTETGTYALNTTLFSYFNSTQGANEMTTRVLLPAGSNLLGHTYSANSRFIDYSMTSQLDRKTLSAFQHVELVFEGYNVSYTDNEGFQVYFTLGPAGYLQYAASFLYIAIATLALAYVASNLKFKPSKAVEIEKEQIPVDEMDQFFNLFSEKTGAEKRIAELRAKRRKGKLSKKDYDGKVKAIRRRLRDLNPQLETAAEELSSQGGRYENYVKRVMLSSQRQSDIRRNAREAKLNYEKGNIPKNIYQLRIQEFNQELKKQESTINRTLTEMVEIIQKYNQ